MNEWMNECKGFSQWTHTMDSINGFYQWIQSMDTINECSHVCSMDSSTGFNQWTHPILLGPSFQERTRPLHEWTDARLNERQNESMDSLNGFNQGTQTTDSINGFTQWIHSMDSINGFMQWTRWMDSLNGLMQWVHSMDSINGFIQWTLSMDARDVMFPHLSVRVFCWDNCWLWALGPGVQRPNSERGVRLAAAPRWLKKHKMVAKGQLRFPKQSLTVGVLTVLY